MTEVPVKYMQRTREYYSAQGFEKIYQWAHNDFIPWHSPVKSLSESTVTFITTAVPDGTVAKMTRSASSHAIEDIPDSFRTDELSWDKEATHTRDRSSYIPLPALQSLKEQGAIGQLASRFHFVPTEYSQRNTNENDAPAILRACQEDAVDIALLVPL